MLAPASVVQNLGDRIHHLPDLVIAVVKVWRHAYPRLGAIVDDDVTRQQLARNLVRARGIGVKRHRAAASLVLKRRVDLVAFLLGKLDQQVGLAQRLCADVLYPYLSDDLHARLDRIQRRDSRRAVHQAVGVVAHVEMLDIEGERLLMRKPAGDLRFQRGQQVGPRVHEHSARAATQPFQRAADVEIDLVIGHVDRDDANAVVAVQQHLCPDRVRLRHDFFSRQDIRRPEQDVTDADQPRPLVDRVEQFVDINADAVGRADDVELHMAGQPAPQHVHVRREVHVRNDDLVSPRVAEIERREQNAIGNAGVLVDQHRSGGRAYQRGDLVPHRAVKLPPRRAITKRITPRADTQRRPGVRILAQAVIHAARHRAERIADHVVGFAEDREFITPLEQRVRGRGRVQGTSLAELQITATSRANCTRAARRRQMDHATKKPPSESTQKRLNSISIFSVVTDN